MANTLQDVRFELRDDGSVWLLALVFNRETRQNNPIERPVSRKAVEEMGNA